MTDNVGSEWMRAVDYVVDDFMDRTWPRDKCMVILHGMPGSGKSTFRDLLIGAFRNEFRVVTTQEGRPRLVRFCSSAMYELRYGVEEPRTREWLLQDVAEAVNLVDVVVVDEKNIEAVEWRPIQSIADTIWRGMKCDWKIYHVRFVCRSEEHALALNRRSWHPLPEDEVRRLYAAYIAADQDDWDTVIESNI